MAEVNAQSDSKQRRGRKQGGETSKREKEEKAPTMWFAFMKSLQCKSEPSKVHDPKSQGQLSNILTKKAGGRSGCSRSIANLKDVIHGSKRHLKPPSCSPRSIGSSEFLNPITHEVILSSNSRCELKITGYGGYHDSPFVGTLTPGTPGPTWQHGLAHNASFRGIKSTPPRPPNVLTCEREENGSGVSSSNHASSRHRASHDAKRGGGGGISCHRCGEQFGKLEALESHHLSKHAGN
jgi:hypothetical protein